MKSLFLLPAIVIASIITIEKASADGNLYYVGSYDSLVYSVAVAVSGDYAYVADHVLGMVIFEVAETIPPYYISRYPNPPFEWPFDIDIKGDIAYLATGSSEPYQGTFSIIDVTDKAYPSLLGSLSFSWEITAVEVDIGYAYLASAGGQLHIVDISNPSNPTVVHTINLPWPVLDMYVRDYLYIAGGISGIHVIDVRNPQDPQIIGGYDTPGSATAITLRIRHDRFAYVADFSSIQIIDITDPANPTYAGSYSPNGHVTDIIGGEFYVYASGDSGISMVMLGDPLRPRLIGSSNITPAAQGIGLGYLIAVVGGQSLSIFRIHGSPCHFIPGDINNNGNPNGIDIIYGVVYFRGGNPPPVRCPCPPHGEFYLAGDVNASCQFSGVDLTYFVNCLRGRYPELMPCPDCPPNY